MEMIHNTFKGEGAINYRGEQRKVKLTLNAFRMMTVKFRVGLDHFDNALMADPLTTIAQLTYCGLVNAGIASGNYFEDDFDTFCSFFYDDESGFTEMQELLTAVNPAPEEKGGDSGNE